METARALGVAFLILTLLQTACSTNDLDRSATSNPLQTSIGTPIPTKTPLIKRTKTQPPPSPTPSTTPSPTQEPTPSPTFTPTVPPCWSQGGKIDTHLLYTDISPWPWEFRVYTPPCYEEQTEKQYPLLVLIHGSTFRDDQWDRLGADETADALIASGDLPPFLILMPRDRIWTEPEKDPFGIALVEHILPWVEENYRTIPERDFRAIGGLSRGASWAVHLGLSHWELFSAIGGHSLPVFVTDPPRIRVWLDTIPSEDMPRFFLDIGENDYLLDKAIWFENLLTEKNIPHEWHLFTGRHEEAYWKAHIEGYLRWYAGTW